MKTPFSCTCLVLCVLSLAAAAQAHGEGGFFPLDLTPLFNQPHTNAFPEAPDGFQGWFESDSFRLEETVETFAPTPWRPEYADKSTPTDFADWASATFFRPQGHAREQRRRIPFRVERTGNDVIAFDRDTVPLEKTIAAMGQRASHVHLLACGGWWPKGAMQLRVTYTDGTTETVPFKTHEWLEGPGSAVQFRRGNLFHHCVALSRPEQPIRSLTIVDAQKGPQLLVAAVTLERRTLPEPAPHAEDAAAAWKRLEQDVVRLDHASIVVDRGATALLQFAALELQRGFYRLSGEALPIKHVPPGARPAIVFELTPSLGDESFRIHVSVRGDLPVLRIRGGTPRAVLYGAYTLLEQFGVGFFLGGDVYPSIRVPLLVPAHLDITGKPVFQIRGSLPWFNFLDSPTPWNYADYKFYIDQMVKQRCNFVGFHAYDSEPFCAFEFEGKLRGGGPLVGSSNYGWGTVRPMKTGAFGFGTDALFDAEDFASDASLGPGDTRAKVRRAQTLLRRAFAYAKSKGMRTCLGFELHDDPTDPREQRLFAARLEQVLASYPMLDYVWLWQPESLGRRGWPVPAADTGLAKLVHEHYETFGYLGKRERIVEAARLTGYVRLAHALIEHFTPRVRLVIAGWGGDRWMQFSDFFVGFDSVLPTDVVFTALDNIDPTAQAGVSTRYGEVKRHEVWPIPWFESDGGGTRRDQWAPQCNVRPFVAICRDAPRKKAGGLLGIHWRTRGVEDVVAYTTGFAWQPSLTYAEFFFDFAKRCFGGAHAVEMSRILKQLDEFGPRWTGGSGQVECGKFAWFSSPARPQKSNLDALHAITRRLETLRKQCSASRDFTAVERIDRILHTIRFVTHYDEAALLYCKGGPVERLLAAERRSDAAALLEKPVLGQAMWACAGNICTRSDLGVLATINVKAYAAYCTLRTRSGLTSGPRGPLRPPQPLLLLPVHNTTYDVGEPVVVKAIAVAATDHHPAVSVFFRRIGEKAFWHLPMHRSFRSNYQVTLKDVTRRPGAFEYYIEAQCSPGVVVRRPVGAPERLFSATVRPTPGDVSGGQVSPWPEAQVTGLLRRAQAGDLFRGVPSSKVVGTPPPAPSGLTATQHANTVRLAWSPLPEAMGYHVDRLDPDGRTERRLTRACPAVESQFIDTDVEAGHSYTYGVRAIGRDWVVGPPSAAATCRVRYVPPAEVALAKGEITLLAICCAVLGPAGRIDLFSSFERDKVLLRTGPIDVEKVRGYGYCWDPGVCGCWADPRKVQFRILGLRPGTRYTLWMRCVSWENAPRTVRVVVDNAVRVPTWELVAGQAPRVGWRSVPFEAKASRALVEVQNVKGMNAVISELVLAGPRGGVIVPDKPK